MKKLLAVPLCVLFLAAFLPKPAAAEVTFNLGVRAGVSMASTTEIWEGETDPSSALTKPLFGGFLAINFNKTFTFQPEVYYLTQGGVWKGTIDESSYEWFHTLDTLHIPLLAKVHVMTEGKAIPIVFAGPAVDFLLAAKEKLIVDEDVIFDESFKEDLKSLFFSFVFGGGVEVKMDKIMLILDVRYALGLNNTVKGEFAEDWSLKNKTLMFVAGVGF